MSETSDTSKTKDGTLLELVRQRELEALNEAYSDVRAQVTAIQVEYGCSFGLALRLLAADRLAMHEGTERIIAAERKARKQQARIA